MCQQFFCGSCRKHKPIDQKVMLPGRKLPKCQGCVDNIQKNQTGQKVQYSDGSTIVYSRDQVARSKRNRAIVNGEKIMKYMADTYGAL